MRIGWKSTPGNLAEHLSRGKWILYRHLHELSLLLLEAVAGRKPRLIISMPPRHGKCIDGDSPIQLSDGRIIKARNIKPGDRVVALNSSYKTITGTVVAVAFNGLKPLIRITLLSGRHIDCTGNHRLLTIDGWIEASGLHVGGAVASVRKIPAPDPKPLPEGFAFLVGYLAGRGTQNPRITYDNKAIVDRILSITCKRGWNLIQEPEGRYRICPPMPDSASYTHIPEVIMASGAGDTAEFLGAYYNCHGRISGNMACYQGRHELYKDLQSLLSKIGVFSQIRPDRLTISGPDLVQFSREVSVIGDKGRSIQDLLDNRTRSRVSTAYHDSIPAGWQRYLKKGKSWHRSHSDVRIDRNYRYGTARRVIEQVAAQENNPSLFRLCSSDIVWDRITGILPLGVSPTYDIQVSPTSDFLVDGIVTHNSELVSRWLPIWFLDMFPQYRVILASYEADYAASWGRKVRNTIQEYKDQLRVRVSDDSSAADRWDTTAGGGMTTAGVNGPITGRGAELMIIDDPVKSRKEAESETYRENTWDWWTGTARSRLEPMPWTPYGIVIVVATRWHLDDLSGRLLARKVDRDETYALPWFDYNLPAIAEESDLLGRTPGEALWPQKYSVNALYNIRDESSPYDWMSLYQQRPQRREGTLFRPEFFKPIDVIS